MKHEDIMIVLMPKDEAWVGVNEVTEEKKARPGRPRIHENDLERKRAYLKEKRIKDLETMPQAKARKYAEMMWKQHAREIIDTFIECQEFDKNRQPVIYQDKLLQFNANIERAKGFRKISLGGKLTPAAIVRELDFLKSQYYHLSTSS